MIEELDFREKGMDRYVRLALDDMRAARDELLSAIADVRDADWQRYVPYESRTLHDLLAHLAGADHAWALAAQDLLKGESETRAPLTPSALQAARERAIVRGRKQSWQELLAEMARRRKLLVSLYELLEPRHLALSLAAFGEEHNSVREHVWLGYHDRLHAADIRRALRLRWHPPQLRFVPELRPAVDALSPSPALYVVYNVDPARWERRSPVPGGRTGSCWRTSPRATGCCSGISVTCSSTAGSTNGRTSTRATRSASTTGASRHTAHWSRSTSQCGTRACCSSRS